MSPAAPNPRTPARRLPTWLWLPPGVIAAQIAAKAIGEHVYRTWMRGELGIVENLTVLFLVLAVIAAVRLWRARSQVASRWFGAFAAVMAAGCFFFAGEEASWGQHWLGFAPPEAIAERNDQGEFNIHNDPLLEKVFDQLPRGLLTLAALVGGVIAPLTRRRTAPDFASPGFGWIWPPIVCLPPAFFAVTVSLPEKTFRRLHGEVPLPIRHLARRDQGALPRSLPHGVPGDDAQGAPGRLDRRLTELRG